MTLNNDNAEPKSAKQYVYDLLIAEYLWNHNYVYTMSVFASEAPLLVNFHKHAASAKEEGVSRQKLRSDYIWHTLETLGVDPREAKGRYIMAKYAENDVPLLLCILQCLGSMDENGTRCNGKEKDRGVVSEVEKFHRNQEVQTDDFRETVTQEAAKLAEAKKRLLRQRDLFDAQLQQKEAELKEQAVIVERQLTLLQEKLEQAKVNFYV